jgi:hypothetical protein
MTGENRPSTEYAPQAHYPDRPYNHSTQPHSDSDPQAYDPPNRVGDPNRMQGV